MKRGSSGYSLVVGVNKPQGMSSHDVVDRCRAIFGERRVGHAGTLDPMATGVLPVLVGPATRLDAFLGGHDKRYRARIVFGASTDTDDAQGSVVRTGPVPAQVADEGFARRFVEGLVGARKQVPPVYSAISVGGERSYAAARSGTIVDLAPRDIEVYEARLAGMAQDVWDVDLFVSKGTYIRAIARDMGVSLGCPAHLGALERTSVGGLGLSECVGLEALAEVKSRAAVDPVRLLGCRFAFVQGAASQRVGNGACLAARDVELFEQRRSTPQAEACSCTSGVRRSCAQPCDGELVAIVVDNRLAAMYEYDESGAAFKARCVFQTGVSRGGDI